jgi:MFS family permease
VLVATAGSSGMRTETRAVHEWWTVATVSVATFMLLLDFTVANTALPAIREDLGASFTEPQWVVDAYTLTLAVLVLTAGALADRFGRRRLFVAGLALFSVASLTAGLAREATLLNAGRAVQGAGGAVLVITGAYRSNGTRDGIGRQRSRWMSQGRSRAQAMRTHLLRMDVIR